MAKQQSATAQALRQVGRLLRAYRQSQRETQGAVARRIGVDTSRISELERGTTDAQFSSLDRTARALGLTGGILELIETGGDHDLAELIRAWKALPTPAARVQAVDLLVTRAFPGRGPARSEQVLSEADARLLDAFRALPPDVQTIVRGLMETHRRRDVTAPGAAAPAPARTPGRKR